MRDRLSNRPPPQPQDPARDYGTLWTLRICPFHRTDGVLHPQGEREIFISVEQIERVTFTIGNSQPSAEFVVRVDGMDFPDLNLRC